MELANPRDLPKQLTIGLDERSLSCLWDVLHDLWPALTRSLACVWAAVSGLWPWSLLPTQSKATLDPSPFLFAMPDCNSSVSQRRRECAATVVPRQGLWSHAGRLMANKSGPRWEDPWPGSWMRSHLPATRLWACAYLSHCLGQCCLDSTGRGSMTPTSTATTRPWTWCSYRQLSARDRGWQRSWSLASKRKWLQQFHSSRLSEQAVWDLLSRTPK